MQIEELSAREGQVLVGLVEEYISTGRPVGSTQLVESLDLPVSPATVRNILRVLDDEEYIFQPHTSAGRIPTDKGYRYFVDHKRAVSISAMQSARLAKMVASYQQQYSSPARAVAQALADASGTLAVTSLLGTNEVRQAGLSVLARQFPLHAHESMQEVLEMLDNVESFIDTVLSDNESDIKIYIGNENPAMPTQYTSVLARRTRSGADEAVVLLVGPKRMPYHRNIAWVNTVASLLNDMNL